jgi:release factor glutamine methyltransferase
VSKAVRPLLTQAVSQLRQVGVDSPEQDARQLLAYAAGIELARLPLIDAVEDDQASNFSGTWNWRWVQASSYRGRRQKS